LSNLTGVLLLNLGTPQHHNVAAVRRYLRQFLTDPRVIELPGILRWFLVHGIIAPFRAKQSAHAYKKIWREEGSPLLLYSEAIRSELEQHLGSNYVVALGMRYGKPNIATAIQQLHKAQVQQIVVLPLFPQYASAATGSALQQALQTIARYKVIPNLQVIKDFFQNRYYINALATSILPFIHKDYDFILMSYHGLPERQMVHQEYTNCNMQEACPAINEYNRNCYRAQCYQTSRLLAQNLGISADKWGVAFQSRLGKLPWIQPYTDDILQSLRQRGVTKLVVCCPSFVADCLETLEEIGIRARAQWQSLGGAEFTLVPCLNSSPQFISALAKIIA
jgi:protoporphyrin/coproporphyrin ferrochelatase